MLYFFANISFILIIAIFSSFIICDVLDDGDTQDILNDFIPQIYMRYRKILDNSDEDTITFRRFLRNNKEYNIHIHKLKDVNGFKRHNLIIKEESDDNPLIYINNPVETNIPNAYLTQDKFKEVLNDRILRQRKDFDKKQHKTFATLKKVLHLTTIKTTVVPSTKSKKNPTTYRPRKNISEIKRDRSKITLEVKKTTTTIDPKKNLENITNHTVVESSQSIFAYKPTHKAEIVSSSVVQETTEHAKPISKFITVATKAIAKLTKNTTHVSKVETVSTKVKKETTRKTPPLIVNVSVHTVQSTIRKLIKIDSTTTNKYNSLRINDKETPAETTNSDSDFNAKIKNTTAQDITKQIFYKETELSATEDQSTEKLSTEKSTTKESTFKISSEESISEESTIDKSTNEEPSTETSTTRKPTEELTSQEPTTEESTTKTSTTVNITTKSKRVTLARPLVYMGDWDN